MGVLALVGLMLDIKSPTAGERPSELLGRQPQVFSYLTDPSLDEELSVMSVLVQILGGLAPEDREYILHSLVLRFGAWGIVGDVRSTVPA